ncbi:cytochrome c [Celeribacter baekdonensis]|uniref:Cytochrome c-552 n=1 Tax=Celeribacter baekdonensis B30 TaxID=1208323 RepID=K2KAL1_9RHOB|nr:cytochrome c [Celeribacter baekdonensis]EKE74405.1 cytochrome c-552 [Celeribacter baekdonensis B30]
MINDVRAMFVVCLSALAVSASAQDQNAGAALFDTNCAACHQKAGVGAPGLAPPLAHRELFARLGEEAPIYLSGVLLSGLTGRITANDMEYVGLVMPSHVWLTDAEVLAITNYVLGDLNDINPKLSPEELGTLREAPPDHAALIKIRERVAQ